MYLASLEVGIGTDSQTPLENVQSVMLQMAYHYQQ